MDVSCGFSVVDEGDVGDIVVAPEDGEADDAEGFVGCARDVVDEIRAGGGYAGPMGEIAGSIEDEGDFAAVEDATEYDFSKGDISVSGIVGEVNGARDEEACGGIGEGCFGKVVEDMAVVIDEDEVIGLYGPGTGGRNEMEAEAFSPDGDEWCIWCGGDDLLVGGVVGERGRAQETEKGVAREEVRPLTCCGEAGEEREVETEGEIAREVEEGCFFLTGVDIPCDVASHEHL